MLYFTFGVIGQAERFLSRDKFVCIDDENNVKSVLVIIETCVWEVISVNIRKVTLSLP